MPQTLRLDVGGGGANSKVLEERVAPIEPGAVALEIILVLHDEAVVIQCATRDVERRALVAAGCRKSVVPDSAGLEDLGGVIVSRRSCRQFRTPGKKS